MTPTDRARALLAEEYERDGASAVLVDVVREGNCARTGLNVALRAITRVIEEEREHCAKVASLVYEMMRAQGSLSSDREFVGAATVAAQIATAIREARHG